MLGLITYRSAENVDRLAELNAKGWPNMTLLEQAEWVGHPLDAAFIGYDSPVNIIPTNCDPVAGRVIYPYLNIRSGPGSNYTLLGQLSQGDVFTLLERRGRWGRINRGWINLGADFVKFNSTGASLEFRNASVTATGDGYAVIIIGDASLFEGATLTLSVDEIHTANGNEGGVSLQWYDNRGSEPAGAMLTEAGSTTVTLGANTSVRAYLAMYVYAIDGVTQYNGLMLEVGSVRHDYVPYTPILPTKATKGAYNYSDLNRVEMAVSEISELAGLNLETKTDWSRWDVPTDRDMERYLENIQKIRNVCTIDEIAPDLPHRMAELNYETANNIEKILASAYEIAMTMPRSGELYCGEV